METDSLKQSFNRRKFIKHTSFVGISLFTGINLLSCLYNKNNDLSFGLITDSHYAEKPPKGTKYYKDSLVKLKECISFMNTKSLDFLIHLGDFKDEGLKPSEESTLSFLKTFEKEFSKFKGNKYHVLGNHDMDSISKKQFLTNTTNTYIKNTESFYHFDVKGYRCIVLDANFESDGKSYSKGDFNWTDTNIPQTQLNWLETKLTQSPYPCLIFIHQPIDDLKLNKYSVKNSKGVRKVLETSDKVIAVFQGHKHEEQHTCIAGINYFTFNAMVDYPDKKNNSFSIVHLNTKNKLTIDGYYRSSSRNFFNC